MGSPQLIVNELLAFIQHAIDTMDEVSILQICKSNFTEAEISSGKLLLFQSLGKLDQMPSRRRDGTEKSIQDIVTLLKVTDPDDVPAFVAKELHKLPPVTFDHVDVTRLLKDITTLKTSLAAVESRLEASENTIGDLRAEVLLLRSTASASWSPDADNVNTRRGAQNASPVSSFVSASLDTSAIACNAGDALCPAIAPSTPVAVPTGISASTPERSYAAIAAADKPATSRKPAEQPLRVIEKRRCKPTQGGPRERSLKKDKCDQDGFIKVVKRKRKPACKNQCGTALAEPNQLLRPAVPTKLIYVSRLHYSTRAEDIVNYILAKSNFSLKVEQLESHHGTNFNSFVVRAPAEHLSTFLKEEFWPRGVMFRRFRGRLPDTAQHTTPITRVI